MKVDKKVLYALKAVIGAKVKKPPPCAIDYVYWNNETKELVATDGGIMLVVESRCNAPDEPTGCYRLTGKTEIQKETSNASYVPYKTAIPDYGEPLWNCELLQGLVRLISTGICIDVFRFYRQLKAIDKLSCIWWDFNRGAYDKPVLIRSGNNDWVFTVVIMPHVRSDWSVEDYFCFCRKCGKKVDVFRHGHDTESFMQLGRGAELCLECLALTQKAKP